MPVIVSTVPASRFEKFNVAWPQGWNVRYVAAPYEQQQIVDACQGADYLLVGSVDPLTAETIKACSHLKLIHTEGVSFDKIDIEAAKALGIPVVNNRAVNKTAVAEHCICLMLSGTKRITKLNNSIYTHGYAATNAEFITEGLHEIAGMNVGLIGLGAIGKEVVARLSGWGCNLFYYDPFRQTEEAEKALNIKYVELAELLATCDIVSIHVPVNPTTINMFNRASLQTMKRNALIVNVSRGEIVNNEDLVWALENDIIGGAALDTIAPEPMPADHVLLHMSEKATGKLTLTTHIAGRTDEAFARMLQWAIADIQRRESGEKIVNIVNGVN